MVSRAERLGPDAPNLAWGYRLRVGHQRVFIDFDGAVRIVSIEEVKKPDERTYLLQVILGAEGKPAFVVMLYEQSRRMKGGFTHDTLPNQVVSLSFERGVSSLAAWHEHFGLTQSELAGRIGDSQAAYAQMERAIQP